MHSFLVLLLQNSAVMSVITLLYITVTPWLARRYTAQWRYYAWLVIVIGWLIPFRPQFAAAWFNFKPSAQSWPESVIHTVADDTPGLVMASAKAGGGGVSAIEHVMGGLGILWIAGALSFLAYHALRHFRFMRLIHRWSEQVVAEPVLELVHDLQQELGIGRVQVRRCALLSSPMVSGLFAPVITLPDAGISSGELNGVLRHELVHLKRRDLWYKTLVLLATALHWFNPAVHMMGKAIAEQCEISCDETVLRGSSFEARRQYGVTLISVAGGKRTPKPPGSSWAIRFSSRPSTIHKRIYALMDTRTKRRGLPIVAVIVSCVVMTGGSVAPDPGAPTAAGQVKADGTNVPAKPLTELSSVIYTSSNTGTMTGTTIFTEYSFETEGAEAGSSSSIVISRGAERNSH